MTYILCITNTYADTIYIFKNNLAVSYLFLMLSENRIVIITNEQSYYYNLNNALNCMVGSIFLTGYRILILRSAITPLIDMIISYNVVSLT